MLVVFLIGRLSSAQQRRYNRPSFTSIDNESHVAIGDTKITDDVTGDGPAEVTGGGTVNEAKSEPAPEGGFSVRLISIRGTKGIKSKIKTQIKSKLIAAKQKSNEGNFTIQLSSFLTEAEAKNALIEFQKGRTSLVWMSTAEVKGVIRYRIYSGHYKTFAEAQGAQSKTAQDSGVKEAFVQKVFTKLTAENDLK